MAVPFDTETWIWYSVTLSIVFARIVSRYIQLRGFKKFHLEDWVMCVATLFYTTVVVLLIRAHVTPSNLIPPDQVHLLTKEEIDLRIFGSKMTIALEQCFIATQWLCKTCVLLLYYNLLVGLRGQIAVKVVGAYTFISFLFMELLYFALWCRPFYNYWSVPAANPQCSTYFNHLIFNFVVNVSSDVFILIIPLPMLIRTNLPLRKKILLCFVFSLGLFVIISAILNKYASLTQPYSTLWVYWYVREISTAVIVPNLPHFWALLRRLFAFRSFLNPDGSDESPRSPRSFRSDNMRLDPMNPHARRCSEVTGALERMRENLSDSTRTYDMESVAALGCRPRTPEPVAIWEEKSRTVNVKKSKDVFERAHELNTTRSSSPDFMTSGEITQSTVYSGSGISRSAITGEKSSRRSSSPDMGYSC